MRLRKSKKNIVPLAYPYYFFTVVAVALTGFFDSIYLAISHYRAYTDMGYRSFCAVSRTFNCDTVSQSPYSIFMGVPVPVWGIIGYALFLILISFAWTDKAEKKRIWTLLFFISLGYTCYSIVLALISSYLIHSYCIMCILSYAVNLFLLYFTWLVRKRFYCEFFVKAFVLDIRYILSYRWVTIVAGSALGTGILLLVLFFPAYWEMTPPAYSKDIPTGITDDGHPWIGAKEPELEILEFSDYRCFQCKKMHYFLRQMVQDNPRKIRLIHRHFPMDHTINPIVRQPFHTGAAKMAMLSIYAMGQGKFWEMNDALFDISKDIEAINMEKLAKEAGINHENIRYVFRDRNLRAKLKIDIQAGLKYGLTGTPGFVIRGEIYTGRIPAFIIEKYAE